MTTILTIDDDQKSLQLTSEIISSLGYSSGILANPELLFKRLEAEEFDLILLDIHMPGIDGLSLLKKIKEQLNKLKVKVKNLHLEGKMHQDQQQNKIHQVQ